MTRRGAYGTKTAQTSPKTFGERLRRIRIAWGWSQAQLAESLGSNQRLVSHWERAIATPSGAAMTAISSLVGITADALLNGKGFTIPDIPAKVEGVSKEDMAKHSALSKMLPEAEAEGVMLIDLDTHQTKHLSTTEVVRALKNAKSDGSQVWMVVRVVK